MKRDGTLSDPHNFDPRPVENRKQPENPDHFPSVWLNRDANNTPIPQLFQPTDIWGVTSIPWLHERDTTGLFPLWTEPFIHNTKTAQSDKVEKRFRSSNFGRICIATEKTDISKLARSYASPKLFTSATTVYGKKCERKILVEYSLMEVATDENNGILQPVFKERNTQEPFVPKVTLSLSSRITWIHCLFKVDDRLNWAFLIIPLYLHLLTWNKQTRYQQPLMVQWDSKEYT